MCHSPFSANTVARIVDIISSLTGYAYQGAIQAEEGRGLRAQGDVSAAVITAESLPALARGVMRLCQELAGGAQRVDIVEERKFDSCGCFLDFSRNAVMTVDACKRYINALAALGMNLIVLYTEDTFTVPEYPYMGYLRGRFTPDELRAVDDYAASLGVELVPCIQTLAHLGNFLQWQEHQHMQDQPTVLLADEPDTYAFIEAEIRAIRSCVRTRRLHIGMDEAHGVGLGQYYAKHGPTDRFDLLNRHLIRVVELCEKYGFRPMMWSDMFFRLGSKNNEYYDKSACIPQSVIDQIPKVDMVYWDYYSKDASWYEHMLTEHEKMGKNTIFAGGVWTWSGFLPNVELTYATMEPGLEVCARHKVRTVMATMWGDDGEETNLFFGLNQLPIFSEFCWRGEKCDREAVVSTAEFITRLPRKAYEAFGLFYPGAVDQRTGKALIWCDLLYPLGPQGEELSASMERSRRALEMLADYQDIPECQYASALFDVCLRKGQLLTDIRPRYLAGDKNWLSEIAEKAIPELVAVYDRLRSLHRQLWERDCKRNGWEVLALRYGSVIGRLEDVQYALRRYVWGELDTLCELDEEPLSSTRMYGTQAYKVYVSPVFEL